MSNQIATIEQPSSIIAGFGNSAAFDFMQRQATMLASSALVPKEFSIVGIAVADRPQKIANVVIALEMANRIGASPFSVMQNIYIVHGKPSWSSTFVIASVNGCGRFNAMKFEMTGEGDARTCVAYATEKATGDRLDSPPISIQMAKDEGWFSRSGSKWKTMPELMLRYRAATLFGRLYAPEILMGMRSVEELTDIDEAITVPTATPTAASIMERFTPATEPVDAIVEPETKTDPPAVVEPAAVEKEKKTRVTKEKPAEPVTTVPEMITGADGISIIADLDRAKIDGARLLEAFGISRLRELRVDQLDDVRSWIAGEATVPSDVPDEPIHADAATDTPADVETLPFKLDDGDDGFPDPPKGK